MKKLVVLLVALGIAATTMGCPVGIAAGKAEMDKKRDKSDVKTTE